MSMRPGPARRESDSRTPILGSEGGRSLVFPLALMAIGGLAVIVTGLLGLRSDTTRFSGGTGVSSASAATEGSMSMEDVSLVLERHRESLMGMSGVTGLYVGADVNSNLVLRVLLLTGFEVSRKQIPAMLDGVPVEVEMTDAIRPM